MNKVYSPHMKYCQKSSISALNY